MKYKKYFRKTSLKQTEDANFFLSLINEKKPKNFLEIGVFHGVTARNVCELLNIIHGNEFNYIGVDLFEESKENTNEIIPKTNFLNPLKNFFFKYIKRQNPYSIEAVEDLLNKFKRNVSLIKGNSNIILKKINLSKVDFIFIDGGHDYLTVKNDLSSSIEILQKGGTILCDDYNLTNAPGVKKAIDEIVAENKLKCDFYCNYRFAKIEKSNFIN